MKKRYKTPETVMIEIDNLSLMAAVSGPTINTTPITPGDSDAKQFDFFATPEVEEETPNKNKLNQEEEWDEFEEEE